VIVAVGTDTDVCVGARLGSGTMRAEGTFTVASFVPAQIDPPPTAIEVGIPVGTAVMEKVYEGDVSGRSATIFTSAFDMGTGIGTYVALETFEGRLGEKSGGFAYVHSATTTGSDRRYELFVIVPGSGVGDLAGISGGGGMSVDADDTHRVWFDYQVG
jgi:hypothetical protein